MSGFSAAWLYLREPCDTRSRSEELVLALRQQLPSRPLHVLDLGTGTGANIRYLAARLGGEQRWLAIDNDVALLAQQSVAPAGTHFDCQLSLRQLDMAVELESLPLDGQQLVTGSALLDLVSASWLQLLASRCKAAGTTVLFALSYDGRVECVPSDPDDEWLRNLVNEHQRGDKGFGPALGPDATRHACVVFEQAGLQTRTAQSDWVIGPAEQALQRELIAGWMAAARAIAPSCASRIERWSLHRNAYLRAGTSRIRVGHQDFMAWPTTPGAGRSANSQPRKYCANRSRRAHRRPA